jgi:hypothetical protein
MKLYEAFLLVFVASPLSMQDSGVRVKTSSLGLRIMCLSGAIYLPMDCCISELAL